MNDSGVPQVLTPAQVQQLEEAITEVIHRSGWGQVTLIIEKGRVRKVQLTRSLWCERETDCRN